MTVRHDPNAESSPATSRPAEGVLHRADGDEARLVWQVPEETAVAIMHNSLPTAVMMATPADLEDFAVGFSLTEGRIEDPSEINELTVLHSEAGIELRMWLAAARADAYRTRRRRLTGPTGCGLCGIESLAEAIRPVRVVSTDCQWQAADVTASVAALAERHECASSGRRSSPLRTETIDFLSVFICFVGRRPTRRGMHTLSS